MHKYNNFMLVCWYVCRHIRVLVLICVRFGAYFKYFLFVFKVFLFYLNIYKYIYIYTFTYHSYLLTYTYIYIYIQTIYIYIYVNYMYFEWLGEAEKSTKSVVLLTTFTQMLYIMTAINTYIQIIKVIMFKKNSIIYI